MALRKRRYSGQGVTLVQMTRCPCGYAFDAGEARSDHFLEHHTVDDVLALAN